MVSHRLFYFLEVRKVLLGIGSSQSHYFQHQKSDTGSGAIPEGGTGTLRGQSWKNNLFVWGSGTDQPHIVYGGITVRACRGLWVERQSLTACFCPVTDLDNHCGGEHKTERWSYRASCDMGLMPWESRYLRQRWRNILLGGLAKDDRLRRFNRRPWSLVAIPGAGPAVMQVSDTYGYLRRYTPVQYNHDLRKSQSKTVFRGILSFLESF